MKPRKPSKFLYLFVIQGDYGQGYEDLTAEETWREARARYVEYRHNEPRTVVRIVKRRELREVAP